VREVSNLLLLTYFHRPHVFLLLYSMYVRTNSSLRHSFKAYDPREGARRIRGTSGCCSWFYEQGWVEVAGPVTVLDGLLWYGKIAVFWAGVGRVGVLLTPRRLDVSRVERLSGESGLLRRGDR
jgi:hypothetical protein